MSYKVCPICGTPSHPNAMLCTTCGTTLTDVEIVKREAKPESPPQGYDRRYGEADLMEGELRGQGRVYLFSAALVIALVICGFGALYAGSRLVTTSPSDSSTPASTPVPTRQNGTSDPILFVTATPQPTIVLPTVTPAPPSATFTATEGPCTRQVQSGDDLISLAYSCGHRSQDVIPLILEMNDLSAPEQLMAGDTLQIPWPTATVDANATPEVTSEVGSQSSFDDATADANASVESEIVAVDLRPLTPTPYPTATLLPGVTWHIVQPNENMLSIAYQYGTNAETLSQLNPQIPFSQCDFQYDSGGERCTVLLQVGQQVRVPVPTPTATLTPTLSGSETPTFTPTPTYNAPSALTPGNRAMFGRNDMVTLRWVASGSLNAGEAYHVVVENLTTGTVHTADTSELFYIIPGDWQGQDTHRHEYRWTVSVIRLDDPEHPTYTTEARLFTWEGRGES